MNAKPGRPSPLSHFLGNGALQAGPFSMLGIGHADAPAEVVMEALQRRLGQLDAHPESSTPQADEVRLALHAAAAQLVDPHVRRLMAERWGVKPGWTPAARGAALSEAPVRSASPSAAERLALERDAVLALAMHGGWNRRALRRLTMVAHSRGVSSAAVAEVLRGLSRRPRARSADADPARPDAEPIATVLAPRPTLRSVMETVAPDFESERLVRRVLMFTGAAVVVLAGAIGAVSVLTSKLLPRATPAVTPAPGPAAAGGSSSGSPADLFPEAETTAGVAKAAGESAADRAGRTGRARDAVVVNRELAAAVEGLSMDAAAASARFEAAIASFSADWMTYPNDQLRAGQDAVIEFVYRASASPEVMSKALELVRAPSRALRPGAALLTPEQIGPAAWSLGMLTRLDAEKDLPAAARLDVQSELQASAPGRAFEADAGFADGVWAGLNLMPRLMLPAAGTPATEESPRVFELWRRWTAAVKAVSAPTPGRLERTLLVALETVMTAGPDPAAGNDVAEVVGLLIGELPWRENDESRRWLMRWMSAPAVSAADLHAVTAALVSKASAPGVDSTMVLAENAGDGQRQELRDRFARAWTLGDVGDRSAVIEAWARKCRERLEAAPPATPAEHLASAVMFARLNEAAQLLWIGQTERAEQVTATAADGLEATPQEMAGAGRQRLGEGADTAWAVHYIQVDRNIPERLRLLTERAQSGGSAGLVEASLIAAEAVRGSPESVRRSARDLVRRFAADPAMVNGLLEEAPTMPITADNAQLIRGVTGVSLPALSDARWREAVRRSLVEQLLQSLASQGQLGVIDRLTELFSEAYQGRAADGAAAPDSPGRKAASAPAEESVRVLRLRWQSAASAAIPSGREPFSPDQIARRYASRASLADGMVQRFAADQAALCEFMAYVLAAEQPTQAEAVNKIVAELIDARRHARHILEQINAGERAMVRLWLLRLEGGAA